MFAVTRFRATGDDGAALAAAVAPLLAALAARPGFRDGELGPVRRRPGPVGAGHPLGRRRLLPAGAVGRRGEDRRRAGLGARPRRARASTSPTDADPRGRRRIRRAAGHTLRRVVSRTVRARSARKRKRRMERVEHDLSAEQWTALQAAWGGCAYCGATETPLQRDCVLADLPRRALHARQHRAGVRLVQRQQVQRRGHRLAAAQAARRAAFLVRHVEIRAALALRFQTNRRAGARTPSPSDRGRRPVPRDRAALCRA